MMKLLPDTIKYFPPSKLLKDYMEDKKLNLFLVHLLTSIPLEWLVGFINDEEPLRGYYVWSLEMLTGIPYKRWFLQEELYHLTKCT